MIHRALRALFCLLAPLSLALPAGARSVQDLGTVRTSASGPAEWPGQISQWNSFQRHDFDQAGREAIVVEPQQAAEGSPWLWRMGPFGEESALDVALLDQGFHIVWIDSQDTFGAPSMVAEAKAFHGRLTRTHGLAEQAVVLGLDEESMLAHNLAAEHPSTVKAIIADNPVCDMKSWPAGWGLSEGDPVAWARCMAAWGLDDQSARESGGNPVDRVTDLAASDIPVLHIASTADRIVPYSENSQVVQRRLRQVGGSVQVIERNGTDHGARLLPDPTPIVDFVLRQTIDYQDFMQSRAGVDRFRAKASTGGTVRVVFLGGSVAYTTGWQRFIKGDLIRAYPQAKFEFTTSGVPSLDSTGHAFRLERDLFNQPAADLVFLESAIGDETNGRTREESIRGLEGCIRRLRRAWPEVDIVLLHFPSQRVVTHWSQQLERDVIAAHETVAEHYGLASSDMSAEFAGRIQRGEFRWEDYGGEEPETFGQRLIWRSMQRLFAEIQATTAWEGSLSERSLPDPLDPLSYAFGVQLHPENAVLQSGWTLVPQWIPGPDEKGRDGFALRPTLEATTEGAQLELTFTGRGIGLLVVAGPDVGALAWSIDGGPTQTQQLRTAWSDQVHIPWFHVLETGLKPGEHTLSLSNVTEEGRSAARIQAFLVDRGAPFADQAGDMGELVQPKPGLLPSSKPEGAPDDSAQGGDDQR